MELDELPLELQSPPEKRLVGTLITQKPRASSLRLTAAVVIFITAVTQLYWVNPFGLSHLLPAIRQNIYYDGEIWRLLTATLIHADLGHLLSNMYMLSILGYFIYGYFGSALFPWWTFLGAGIVNALSIWTYPLETRLLGASGWVYLLGGMWLTLYLFIQRQYPFSRRLVRVFGMALMVFFPTSFEATTSYRTHFIGFIVGAMMGALYFIKVQKKIRRSEEYRIFQ